MAFRKNMDIFFALLSTFAVLIFPFVTSENIDCKGKAFYCVNSTHFKICVDFGGGVSKTVDDFQIPCPTNMVCRDINKFECEQLVTTTLAPLQQSDETNEEIELSFTPSYKGNNVMTLISEYKTEEQQLESSSDNLRNAESSSSVTSGYTTNFIPSTTLDESSNQTTLSSENTIRYNKQSDLNLSDIVTVPYTPESELNLVTNSDEFSTIVAKIKKVNDTLLNLLVHMNSTNNRDHLSLEKPIQIIEGSTTEKNVNIEYKNLHDDTANLLPISSSNVKESLSTQSEIVKNDSPYFTETAYVTNDPNIFTVPVVDLRNLSVEHIANYPSVSVLNPVITTESYNTDIEQTTESNDGIITNSINVYKTQLNSHNLSFNNSKNNLIQDSVNSFKDTLSTDESTHIYDTNENIFSKYSTNLMDTGFSTTNIINNSLSADKETLAVLTDLPSTMSVQKAFDDANEGNNIGRIGNNSTLVTSTTPYYKNDSLITLIDSNKYEQSFEQNVTSVPDSIDYIDTENITTISGKQYLDTFTESETTTPYTDLLSTAIFNTTFTPIESLPIELLETSSDNFLANLDLNSSEIEIPIKLNKSHKPVQNNEIATDNNNLLLDNVDHISYKRNISKAANDYDVNKNKTTLLNENTYIDTPLLVEIYNTSNSSESNLVSLHETTTNLTPLRNVTPLNISVDITSETTLQYSSLPEQSTTTVVSEETIPIIYVTETTKENNVHRVEDNNEVTENKTSLLIGSTVRLTTSLIEKYNFTDTSQPKVASFHETTIKLTSQNDANSLNIDVDLNSKTTLEYTSFREQLTTISYSELQQNHTNSYSAVSNPIISVTDTSIENNLHTTADDRKILENKTILFNENRDTNDISLKKTYSNTESSESISDSLAKTQINLTPYVDVTPSNVGVNINSRATFQYIPSSQQSTTNVISETYKNQENTYSVTPTPTISDFKENEMLLKTVSPPVYSSLEYKDKILDKVPYSNNTSNAEESIILLNNSNNNYLNLHSSSLIASTNTISITPLTKQAFSNTDDQIYKNNQRINVLNMTTNSYLSYADNEKNQSQLDTMFIGKITHTTSLNVAFNISNLSNNKVNSTVNSNLNNVDQSTIVTPLLKREFSAVPFKENVDKIETTRLRVEENVTKTVPSQKKNDLKRSKENDETIFSTDTNFPYIFPKTFDSMSDVQDHNISKSEAVFKSDTIPETTSFATEMTKSFKTNVAQTTSHETKLKKCNSNVTNTNSNYVNSNNTIASVNIIDDQHKNFHNVQKITEKTSNISTLDTKNIRSELVNVTGSEGFILSKILKLSTNHSSLKYENTSFSKQNGTNSNEKVPLLQTNMNQNMSFENDYNLLKKDLQQNRNNHYNDIENQPITISIPKNLSNESKRNISDFNSQTIPLLSQFSCLNRHRGKYPDKNNCTKFYICIGKLHPINGMCPSGTVFSEINKQCTKNLSHCIRNNEFRCLTSGRFINVLSDKFYYICAKSLGGYIRFKLQCQEGYRLNKENISCVSDSSSIENVSKTDSDVNTDEKTSKEFKQSEKYTKQFHCVKEGKFEHPDDCRKYFVCKKGSKSQYRRKVKKCDSDEVFNKEKQKCVDSDTYEC